jgi:hypothetical protein
MPRLGDMIWVVEDEQPVDDGAEYKWGQSRPGNPSNELNMLVVRFQRPLRIITVSHPD